MDYCMETVFWTQQGSCVYELTVAMTTCTRLMKSQAKQKFPQHNCHQRGFTQQLIESHAET